MKWKNEIQEIFDLATLHSWCNQVNELLDDFNTKYQEDNDVIKYLKDVLNQKNLPNEHYIISIVILNNQKYPTKDIIELAISSLYSKLNKNDILFFKDHLFSGRFPLSSDLSEDITNRAFLSPKVAIKKAMQIDSVISKNNPIITVLYMNFILSRMDMNEENRAMVAFLLLRVDVVLPKSLNDRVYKYLLEYKDIIKELLEEEMGETVILDDIASVKEKINKIQIIEKEYRPAEDNKTEKTKEDFERNDNRANNIENKGNTYFKDLENDGSKVLNTDKQALDIKQSKISTEESTKPENTVLSDEAIDNRKIADKDASKVADSDNSIKKSEPEKDNKKQFTDNSEFRPIAGTIENIPLKKEEIILEKETSADTPDMNEIFSNRRNNLNKKSKKEELKIGKKSWNIGLKQNQQILESILAGVKNIKEKKLSSKKIKKEADNNKSDKIPAKIKLKLPNKKSILTVSAIILLIIIPIIIERRKTPDNATVIEDFVKSDDIIQKQETDIIESMESELETIETDIIESPISELETAITDSNTIPESSLNIIPEDFPINITINDNQIVWNVVEGESITDLYFALKEFSLSFEKTKMEKLSKMEWDAFFDRFINNNPVRASYHIIFPGEEFILPLE